MGTSGVCGQNRPRSDVTLLSHAIPVLRVSKFTHHWTDVSVNTYAALIVQQRPPKESPLSCCVDNAFAVFAYIEHGQDTTYGRHAHLVVRAVAAWLTIAGEELVAAGSPTRKYSYSPGSSWKPECGGNTVNVKRLQFCKDAIQQLRESGRLSSQEAVNATVDAAAAIDRLIAVQG
jgi:hypothetical protein